MEQKFIEMAKTIIQSLDIYRKGGRSDRLNEISIAEYLELQQNFCKPDVSGRSEQLICSCSEDEICGICHRSKGYQVIEGKLVVQVLEVDGSYFDQENLKKV